jgi:hypothetical protein
MRRPAPAEKQTGFQGSSKIDASPICLLLTTRAAPVAAPASFPSLAPSEYRWHCAFALVRFVWSILYGTYCRFRRVTNDKLYPFGVCMIPIAAPELSHGFNTFAACAIAGLSSCERCNNDGCTLKVFGASAPLYPPVVRPISRVLFYTCIAFPLDALATTGEACAQFHRCNGRSKRVASNCNRSP